MSTTFQDLQEARSYYNLLSEIRTLSPSQVLTLRECIHLLKNGRHIVSPAPTEITHHCHDCSMSIFGQCDRHKSSGGAF